MRAFDWWDVSSFVLRFSPAARMRRSSAVIHSLSADRSQLAVLESGVVLRSMVSRVHMEGGREWIALIAM